MDEWEKIHKEIKHQYIIKNMQEMGIDKYELSDKFYESYEEAVEDVECEGLFRVWCKFKNPGFIKRENRKYSEVQFKGVK